MTDGVSVAVLLDDPVVEEWQRLALDRLVRSDDVDAVIELVVLNGATADRSRVERLRGLAARPLWTGLLAVGALRRVVAGPAWYRETTPIAEVAALDGAERRETRPTPADGLGVELPADALEALEGVDVAVRFGFGVLVGAALTAPRHGVLSYHHGDLAAYRGRPAGFYEFVHGEPEAGVTVQRLTETLDGGAVAAATSVDVADAPSWGAVRDAQFAASPDLLPTAVRRAVGEELEPPAALGELYTIPTARAVLAYVVERCRRVLR